MRNDVTLGGHRLRTFMALSMGLLLTSCGILGPDLDEVGTVTLTVVGCWGIRTTEDLYEPDALAQEFRVDGLQVRFEADFVKESVSICSIGPVVKIKSIERLDP